MADDVKVIKLEIESPNEAIALLGNGDSNVKVLEEELGISVITRGEAVSVAGDIERVTMGEEILKALLTVVRKGIAISSRDVLYAIELARKGTLEYFGELYDEEIAKTAKGKSIKVKTIGQRYYIQAIKKQDLVFGIGPAGTGKTYLAVVMAINALKNGHVKRIILTRPAVEAGESLGFLPGDLKEKVDPYLRPLYDALHDLLGMEQTQRMIERGTIEIAPLAYMRGRTLEDAFVILDEAQNTTEAQMKMFLTRLGFGSKMVITGDRTQIDLPKGMKSGLVRVEEILKNVKGLSFVYFEQSDVVRHPLVAKIITAYEQAKS
ncbi:PhoH family protein [Peribacillus castrilensis]|mgnify:CR=1 FL=1|jgi:phosphate starvation-inducible PhoH-like protein|uniref:PhoH-like protein n=4 Tax=Peribacillus TaxID=2675229 RepID=A0AAJ1VF05_9BACI|nr:MULTISPECIES: PhoH family protein [Bacillaceae]KOR79713.1 phosphate starvation-inducible protein PhoH [Bacillus sp. FJAT-21352]KOR86609.1 phosphate starvation-inducible protein PhoH [Bacillus sp. FJAT-22058]MBD8135019.1 PhoH family protein [Bacillus sp. CFBP 13597]MBL3642252.1 PhoH family protein [Bacillus sp. RHFB]MBT2602475.1 PhoH family protein [Bacillus sp. ISL-53]MCD1161232.1 PhoH family protein [Peribacillus castrilensis]MCP1092617.1 PhoH family protein [Bacillaceae bacterium OS4b]